MSRNELKGLIRKLESSYNALRHKDKLTDMEIDTMYSLETEIGYYKRMLEV